MLWKTSFKISSFRLYKFGSSFDFARSAVMPPLTFTLEDFSLIELGHFSYLVTSSSAAGKFNVARQLNL